MSEDISGQVLELPADTEAAAYHLSHPNESHGHSTSKQSPTIPNPPLSSSSSSSTQFHNQSSAAEPSTNSRVRYDEQGLRTPSKNNVGSKLASAVDETGPIDYASPESSSNNERLRRASQLSLAPSVKTAGAASLHSRDGSLRTHAQGSVRGSAKGTLRMKQKIVTTPAWARSENSTPTTSPQLRASNSQSGGAIPSLGGALGSVDNLSPALQASSGSNHQSPSRQNLELDPKNGNYSEEEDPEQLEGASKGPERFWTFALPTKNSSRIRNQQLKLSVGQDDGSTGSPIASPKTDEGGARKFRGVWSNHNLKENGKSRERGNTSGAASAGPSSSPVVGRQDQGSNSDEEGQAEEDADRTLTRRGSGDGMAGSKAALAAAGIGASNLMGRRRNTRMREDSADGQPKTPLSSGFEEATSSMGQDEERGAKRKSSKDGEDQEEDGRIYQNDPFFGTGVLKARMPAQVHLTSSFTRHQPQTPGWETPWRPESRGGNSIEIDGYRFGADGELGKSGYNHGYFPRTDTRSSKGLKRRRFGSVGGRRGSTSVGGVGMNEKGLLDHSGNSRLVAFFTPRGGWKDYMLHDPFVPLLFRLLNLCITTSTLAVAIKIHLQLQNLGDTSAVGSSPLLAIIFAPMTLVHVAIQVYMEYFGRPIGLWNTASKLFYTLIEVLFIALWSAELGLTFDNYFTSPLVCLRSNSIFTSSRVVCVPNLNGSRTDGIIDYSKSPEKPSICRLQGALIGLTFVSLLAYIVVFSVSLFRIFVRVSGTRRT